VKNIGRRIAIVLAFLCAGAVQAYAREQILVSAPYAAAPRIIRLAKLGDIKAEAQLGWMYSKGRGLPQNYFAAAHWYYLAAQRGHGGAQFELGLMYNKGEGVPRDFVLAYFWLNLSASQAVGDDRDFKAGIRDSVASKMTVAQVAVAQEMARAWYQLR
jgi:TPR repeat protein